MRKVSFGLAVGFVLVACGGGESEPPKTPATPAPTMTTAPATTASAVPPKQEPKKTTQPLYLLQQAALLKDYAEGKAKPPLKDIARVKSLLGKSP